ncbi:MAG: tetratricopeptide repeat protein, partial [Muribaculaceae bacterium]|nr:tetratricopeptide repeat protein [Muribaculaceae bacterium]
RFDKAFDLFTEGLRSRNELSNSYAMRLARRKLSVFAKISEENDYLREQLETKNRLLEQLATEYVSMGEDCRDAGDIDSAMANYDKAIRLAPDYAAAWLAKGMASASIQDVDGAIDAFTQADRLNPESHRAALEIGQLYLSVGDYHNAMDRLLVAEERNPDSPGVHTTLADIYEAIGDETNAIKHRKTAARLRKHKK